MPGTVVVAEDATKAGKMLREGQPVPSGQERYAILAREDTSKNLHVDQIMAEKRMTMKATRIYPWALLGLCLCLASSWGCTIVSLTSGASELSADPYLVAAPAELQWVQELSKKQARMIQTCPKSPECERARYTYALTALFENGATAASAMKAVVDQAPSGPFATASARWLQVLDMGFPTSSREHAMRAYLSVQVLRELASLQTGPVPLPSQSSTAAYLPAPAPALQQRVKDQERRIAELTSQLQMLKHIDQGRLKDR